MNKIIVHSYVDESTAKKLKFTAKVNQTNQSEIVRRMIEFCIKISDKKELNRFINKHNKWLKK
jgi:hypothetical protein